MAVGDVIGRSKGQNPDDNLSSAFVGFSRSVDRLSESLNKASKAFAGASSQFEKAQTDGQSFKEKADKKANDELKKDRATFVDSLKVVGRRFIDEFAKGFNSVSRSYLDNFSKITTSLNLSVGQYSKMYRDSADQLIKEGLKFQFSPTDYADSLATVLDTGLRGRQAQDLAYQNLITNKLVPAISTNTIAYRQMSKEFGRAFNQNITAMARYTETVYGSTEGISEGKLDSMLSTLQNQIRYAAGGDAVKANEAINQLMANISTLERRGIDSSDYIQQLYGAATGAPGSATKMNVLWGAYTPNQIINQLSSQALSAQNLGRYVSAYASHTGSANELASFTKAMEGSSDIAYAIGAQARQGVTGSVFAQEALSLSQGFEQSNQYQKDMANLQRGMYTSVTEQLNNYNENIATDVSTLASEYLPDVDRSLRDIKGIAQGILGSLITGNFGFGDKIGDKLTSSLKGKLGSIKESNFVQTLLYGKVTGGFTMMDPLSGQAVSNLTRSGKGLARLSGSAGKLLGPLAGAGIAGYDLYTGWKEGGAGEGLFKMITGAGDHASYQTGGSSAFFSALGDTAKNAVKGALVGSAVPGIGTAIGAGVGLLAGAAGAAAKYFDEDSILARATNSYAESLKEMQNTQEQYDKTIKQSDKSLEDLSKISNINGEATQEQTDAFKRLKATYPDLLANINDVSDMDKEYIDVIKLKIKYENKKMLDQLAEDTEETSRSAVKFGKSITSKAKQVGAQSIMKGISEGRSIREVLANTGYSEKEAMSHLIKYASSELGVGPESLVDDWYNLDDTAKLKGLAGALSGNYDWESYSQGLGELEYHLQQEYSNLLTTKDSLIKLLEGGDYPSDYRSITKDMLKSSESGKKILSIIDQYNQQGEYLITNSASSVSSDVRSKYSRDGLRKEITDLRPSMLTGIIDKPSFRVGLNYVPYDNFSANLHQGEMVLTSTNASKLRGLLGGSIGPGLTALSSLFKATSSVSYDDTPGLEYKEVVSLSAKVDTITEILNVIKEALLGISIKSGRRQEPSSQVSEAMISYQKY